MSEIKLLPCTHCEDGKAVFHVNELTDKYHVVCCDCGCRTADFKNPEEAINQWNTRKPMERILTRLEELNYPYSRELHDMKLKAIDIVKEEGGIE